MDMGTPLWYAGPILFPYHSHILKGILMGIAMGPAYHKEGRNKMVVPENPTLGDPSCLEWGEWSYMGYAGDSFYPSFPGGSCDWWRRRDLAALRQFQLSDG